VKVGVLTVSDGVASGSRVDRSGPAIAGWARAAGYQVVGEVAVADDGDAVVAALLTLVDGAGADLVLTTGGTGLGPRDITPEATRAVIDREVPGIAELLRTRGADSTPFAALGRGVAGCRGRALIINLPGAPGAVVEGLAVLSPLLPHAARLLAGDTEH
jgi:molybdenum cofactor synthesis domain-containing protein